MTDYLVTFPNGTGLITDDLGHAQASLKRSGGTLTTLPPLDASESNLSLEDLRVEEARDNRSPFPGRSK